MKFWKSDKFWKGVARVTSIAAPALVGWGIYEMGRETGSYDQYWFDQNKRFNEIVKDNLTEKEEAE